ncbi:ATP synthase subunit C [Peptoniphilus equinus]|uniref:ATP synthase subunit C n=1 Tax=Peptoniphilus equinus TaxID=3016343 RepID=A0ABY7QSQ2_9FIRM|nr:ATP synthase subunit C [Peptoniphilus equinus]WBW49767.1 ATP synthase subunit C [Peptoniphilus equinus]
MEIILVLASLVVFATIYTGFVYIERGTTSDKAGLKKVLRTNLSVFIPVIVAAFVILAPKAAEAATAPTPVNGLGLIAAALSTGMATIGTGYAVGIVGSAALGAVSEDDSILGKTLIFVGLAEGIAIYGLIISIMILGKL